MTTSLSNFKLSRSDRNEAEGMYQLICLGDLDAEDIVYELYYLRHRVRELESVID